MKPPDLHLDAVLLAEEAIRLREQTRTTHTDDVDARYAHCELRLARHRLEMARHLLGHHKPEEETPQTTTADVDGPARRAAEKVVWLRDLVAEAEESTEFYDRVVNASTAYGYRGDLVMAALRVLVELAETRA